MLLVLANTKGGSGKTSLATSILAELAREKSVIGVDLDTRRSSEKWSQDRTEDQGKFYYIEGDIKEPLVKARGQYHDVVVDTGGYDTQELRTALLLADAVLLPLGVGSNDNIDGFRAVLDILEQILPLRKDNPPRILGVVVFAPHLHHTAEFARALDEIRNEPIVQLCKTVIGDRIWYSRAKDNGLGVTELKADKRKDNEYIKITANEFMSLFNEIYGEDE